LHNQDWLREGKNDTVWGSGFAAGTENGNMYEITAKKSGGYVVSNDSIGEQEMKAYAPWQVNLLAVENSASENENGFKRVIYVYPYACGNSVDCSDYVRVVSRVFWTDAGSEKEVKLDEIFTNWKGGAL
jgi:hypothetical protein